MILAINNWDGMLTGSLVGILVVFVALAILVMIFEYIQRMSIKATKNKVAKATGKSKDEITDVKNIPAGDIAAISVALHLYMNDLHDTESNIITIKRIERRYSPWNSKIYGLTNINR